MKNLLAVCKVTHIWFWTNENVYNSPIYSWSHIKISLSLEM